MVRYIPQKIVNQPHGFFYYVKSPYKSAIYNFKASIPSNYNTIQKVANPSFKKRNYTSYQKTTHFFKHIAVGSLLMIPIINIFIFIGLLPKTRNKNSVSSIKTDSKPAPEPEPFSPVKKAKADIEEKMKQQAKVEKPVLDGKRKADFSFKEGYAETAEMTKTFFHYFPEETKTSAFAALRKKEGEEDPAPLFDDIKFVEDLIIAQGISPQERLRCVNANFPSLIDFLEDKFPELNGSFYLCANYKNPIKDKAKGIPYIEIIKALFLSENDAFIELMESYDYKVLKPLKGERTPIQINRKEVDAS